MGKSRKFLRKVASILKVPTEVCEKHVETSSVMKRPPPWVLAVLRTEYKEKKNKPLEVIHLSNP